MAAVRTQTRLVHKLSIKGQFILVILYNIMHLFSIGNNIWRIYIWCIIVLYFLRWMFVLNLLNNVFVSFRDAGHKCPVDNEILLENQLFPDNFAKREILSLMVKCPNEGCLHKMELRHLEVLKLFFSHVHLCKKFLENRDFALSIWILPLLSI